MHPQDHGKAERFIKTNVTKWAYTRAYSTSDQSAVAVPIWIAMHNRPRPHSALEKLSVRILDLPTDNLLALHT